MPDSSPRRTKKPVLILALVCAGALTALVGLPWMPLKTFQSGPQVEFVSVAQAVPEGAGALTVGLQLSSAHSGDVTVPFTLTGTGASPADYDVGANPVVIPAGQVTGSIDLTIHDDGVYEGDETIQIDLGPPTDASLGTVVTHTVTIGEDEPAPSISFAAVASARNEDAGTVPIAVMLSAPAAVDVVVPFQSGGTATDSTDFSAAPNPIVIAAGDTQADIALAIVDDSVKEPGGETATLVLAGPQNAVLGAIPAHTLKIRDDDGPYNFGGQKPYPPSLQLIPSWLDFGAVRGGESSTVQGVVVVNNSDKLLNVTQALLAGDDPGDFQFTPQTPLPFALARGQSATVDVTFAPTGRGPRSTSLYLRQVPKSPGRLVVALTGVGLGPIGAELLVNCGGDEHVDQTAETWSIDYGWGPQTSVLVSGNTILSTPEPTLYQSARTGMFLRYDFDLPNGPYALDLHFAELHLMPQGARVFDVVAEGQLLIDDFDVTAAVGHSAATVESFPVTIVDGQLNLELTSQQSAQALLSAVEVRSVSDLDVTPSALNFGILDEGNSATLNLMLRNDGLAPAVIDVLRITNDSGDSQDLSLVLDGVTYDGNPFNSVYQPGTVLAGGAALVVPVTYAPTLHSQNLITLSFEGDFGVEQVQVNAISGFGGDPYLHPVLTVSPTAVDYDGTGQAPVLLDGSASHTHEPGRALSAWEWRENGTLFSSQEVDVVDFPLGAHTVELTIYDDNVPPVPLAATADLVVVPSSAVPGVLALYYEAAAGAAGTLLDAVPPNPDHATVEPGFEVVALNGIGDTGYTQDVLVRLVGQLDLSAGETWDVTVLGGVDHRALLDGVPISGPVAAAAGLRTLEVRWAVDTLTELPLQVLVARDGAPAAVLDPGLLTHDMAASPPVINDMPAVGTTLGGNQIVIDGFGFYPQSAVTVHWGGTALVATDFMSWSADRIELLSPPGSGTIAVTVQTPGGTSSPVTFDYQAGGPVPVTFFQQGFVTMTDPTAAAWGPDGRLYVATRAGHLKAITFDDGYNVLGVATYDGVSGLANHEAMGIAFDPFDLGAPIRVYLAHNEMYAQGGLPFTGSSPYPGQISVLTGPDFDAPVPVVTNLPVSNHDHGINGIEFDHSGDLLICSGGNTNAGVPYATMGDLPESPLAGAVLKAELSRPDFDGLLHYAETATGTPNDDQVSGHLVDLAAGVGVDIQAAGLRNSFDLCLATNGHLYTTDNGPNDTFGPASTGSGTQTGWDPAHPDELSLVEYGHYYGHPNRNRGRLDPIQNVYKNPTLPAEPGFTQSLTTMYSSMNGIDEYRASTFGDQLRGELLVQKLGAQIWRAQLSPDGRAVQSFTKFSWATNGLGLVCGPGGAILVVDYFSNRVRIYVPSDLAAVGLTVYDVFPWRAPRSGGATTSFVIGGAGFGTLSDTTVEIGGIDCFLTSVTPTRIRGWVPALGVMRYGLDDVTVTSAGATETLPGAFRWLDTAPGMEPGRFEAGPSMPLPAGEVACGVIDGVLYLVGEGNDLTYACDLVSGTWSVTGAKRPLVGHHHAAEVVAGKWYLFGGLGAGMGKVQIYDPSADAWTLGADMPWSGGSVSTAAIGGIVYAAGGIVGNTTVDDCAAYDPALDVWSPRAPMPAGQGRNHAASGTEGQLFWIFGGRGVGSGDGNWVANGFDDVQVYDPALDSWSASSDPGSTIPPMPIGRGGTGKAAWYRDEFHVFGGETLSGAGATGGNVYARVDVYDPGTQTWRQEAGLPTPRHGIFPVSWQGRIWIAGGGVVAGFSASDVLETFDRQ